MRKVTAVLSMLHEPGGGPNSASRRFRGEPVLAWTLRRLNRARGLSAATILCWEDQLPWVEPVAGEERAYVSVRSPRSPVPQIEAVAAARRWADGWRGGLLASCEFDRGFYGPWVEEICRSTSADAVLLVDPSAGLVDPVLVDCLIAHSEAHPDVELCFSQAAPGLNGVLLSKSVLAQLSSARIHPGAMIAYRPDAPRRDPIGAEACAPVPTPLARTSHRFTLDSQRQIEKVSAATEGLNGQLMGTEAEGLLAAFDATGISEPLPREVVVEINTERATDAVFWPGRRLGIRRPPMSVGTASQLFAELAALDDVRVTFAGVGDPLLHGDVLAMIDAARAAGIGAVAVESDFVGAAPETVAALAASPVDVVSVHLPAALPQTYRAVMGVDGFSEVFAQVRLFVEKRQAHGRGVPLLAPTFVKCRQNQAEMEHWYDQWLRTLNCAVIAGPSDFGGLIPDAAVADMAPPRRRACARLESRLTVRSDGTIVSCEEDVLARQSVGALGVDSLRDAWRRVGAMRSDHLAGAWSKHAACEKCREWHRG